MSKCTTYAIEVELIVCKADIMRDPVTPRIPAGALLTNPARRERDNGLSSCEVCDVGLSWRQGITKQEVEIGGGSALYIYNNWGMQWGIHAGSPRSETHSVRAKIESFQCSSINRVCYKPKTKPDTYQAVLNLLCVSFETPLVNGKPSP